MERGSTISKFNKVFYDKKFTEVFYNKGEKYFVIMYLGPGYIKSIMEAPYSK